MELLWLTAFLVRRNIINILPSPWKYSILIIDLWIRSIQFGSRLHSIHNTHKKSNKKVIFVDSQLHSNVIKIRRQLFWRRSHGENVWCAQCNKHVRWLPLFFSDNAISFHFIQFVSFWNDLIWFGLVWLKYSHSQACTASICQRQR